MENWTSTLSALLGGLGFGSLFSVWLGKIFEHKRIIFSEKTKCYFAIIESYQNAVTNSNEENRQKFTYWQKRLEVIAPTEVVAISQLLYNSQGQGQTEVRDRMIKAMRKDLGF
jgi:hypothetical protein